MKTLFLQDTGYYQTRHDKMTHKQDEGMIEDGNLHNHINVKGH